MLFFGIISMQWQPLNWLGADINLCTLKKKNDIRCWTIFRLKCCRWYTALRQAVWKYCATHNAYDAIKIDVRRDMIRLVAFVRHSTLWYTGYVQYWWPDELLYTGADIAPLSSRLQLILNADLTLFHLVYLNRNQSANNNWNVLSDFSPGVEYMPIVFSHDYAHRKCLQIIRSVIMSSKLRQYEAFHLGKSYVGFHNYAIKRKNPV